MLKIIYLSNFRYKIESNIFMAIFLDLLSIGYQQQFWNETWNKNQCGVYWTARFLRQKGHIMQLSLKSRFSLISTSVHHGNNDKSSVSTYLLSFTLTQSFKGLRDHNSPDQLFCLDTVYNYQTLIFSKGLVKNNEFPNICWKWLALLSSIRRIGPTVCANSWKLCGLFLTKLFPMKIEIVC